MITTPNTAATIPRPGRESATDVKDETGSVAPVMMDVQIHFHKLVEFEGFEAADCHSHAVAKKVADMRAFQEGGIFGEDWTLVRILDIRFQRHQSLPPGFIQQVVGQLQGIEITLFGKV